MEIPDDLKKLYRHWEKHSGIRGRIGKPITGEMAEFVVERMKIWERRQRNETSPWTGDPVLNKYRFCNIYRELDRQTIEFHALLAKLRPNLALWMLNMMFCRGVCKPDTIKRVGFLSFDTRHNRKVYERLLNLPRPKYGTAYVFPVSILKKIDCKNREEFWCFYLPKKMKKMAASVAKLRNASVVGAVDHLAGALGANLRFHLTELLIDLAYQYPRYIDLFGKFPAGPGAKPTLSRLGGNIAPEDLVGSEPKGFPFFEFDGKKVRLSAENWEGVACEFRKYTNLKFGVGRRRLFTCRNTG